MKEIFLLIDNRISNSTQEVIVLLVEYSGNYILKNDNLNLQFKTEPLKDLGYFAKISNIHNQYKNIPIRSGNLYISNLDLEVFINKPGLSLIDSLGKAVFTENSAELTSGPMINLIDTNDYVPIDARVGVLLKLDVFQDTELDKSSLFESLGI